MASKLAFIGGGLLQGIGQGLVLSGKEKRERKLAEIDHKRDLERDEKQLEGRPGLLDAGNISPNERLGLDIGSRENLAKEATTSRETLASQSTTSRETVAAAANASREGIAAAATASREGIAKIAAGKPSDTSAAEQRAFDSLVEIHTVTDENLGETTDWNAVADGLESKGFGKLAKSARSRGKGIADLEVRKRAEQFADEMVDEQSGFISTDAADFKQDGGSRVRFRARMVREFIAKNGGAGAETPATRPATVDDDPYVGKAPPRNHPDAKRASDGFWYLAPKRPGGKFRRVQNTEANRVSRVGREPR